MLTSLRSRPAVMYTLHIGRMGTTCSVASMLVLGDDRNKSPDPTRQFLQIKTRLSSLPEAMEMSPQSIMTRALENCSFPQEVLKEDGDPISYKQSASHRQVPSQPRSTNSTRDGTYS